MNGLAKMRTIAAGALVLVLAWAPNAAAGKPSVAVMPFESASADDAHKALGKGLQAMITTDLNEVGAYTLVERSRIADIQMELKLVKTGAIDKKTAAKIGKLVGATYLLTGTVTVFQGKMRIDARMFATKSGKIDLAEKIEGAQDEFFDLEKALVKKLVGVTGVKMAPKVRVKVSRVHTADFTAFQAYSNGIEAFDTKKYDRSVEMLKKAAKIDPEFKLAKLTLEQYEQEIQKMKGRAAMTELDAHQAEAVKRDQKAAKEAKWLDERWPVARNKGKANRIARLWAIGELYRAHSDSYRNLPNIHRLEDRFDLMRTGDALAAAYFAESQGLFPKVPLTPEIARNWYWNRAARDDREQKKWDDLARRAVVKEIDWRNLAARLLLDARGHADLLVKAAKWSKSIGADPEYVSRLLKTAGQVYRRAGQIDASTVQFINAQKLTKRPYDAKTLVKEVEANRNAKRVLKECGSKAVKEWLALEDWSSSFHGECGDHTLKHLTEPLTPIGATTLTVKRTLPKKRHIYVNKHPVWVFGTRDMRTGPRSELLRTVSLVYHEDQKREYGVLSVVDGRKTDNLSASFDLGYEPAPGWWPPQRRASKRHTWDDVPMNRERPTMAFLFGVDNVDAAQADAPPPRTDRILPRPLTGYGVMVDDDGVHLVEAREISRPIFRTNHYKDRHIAWKKIGLKKLKSRSARVPKKAKVPFKATLKGKKVSGSVGGVGFNFALPKSVRGYYGIWLDGLGYTSFGNLKFK